jgi:hypothetical protein
MNTLSSIQSAGCRVRKFTQPITYQYWFKFDGNNTNSGSTGTGNLSGGNCVITSTQYKFGTASLYNNGSSNSRFALSSITNTSGYSFSLRVYLTNTQSGMIFTFVQGSNKNNRVFLYWEGSQITISTTGTGYVLSNYLNQWVHLAFTANTSGSTEFYVNGSKYGNTLSTLYTNATLNYCMISGDWYTTYQRSIYSYVDDFRYVDGVLTAAQIASIYTNVSSPSVGTVSGNNQTYSSNNLLCVYRKYQHWIINGFYFIHRSRGQFFRIRLCCGRWRWIQ